MNAAETAPLLGDDNEVAVRQVGQWRVVWRRFRHHRMAIAGAWALLAIVILALVGPFFAPPLPQPNPVSGQFPLSAYQHQNQPPTLSWPGILGTGYVGAPVVNYVLMGGRATLAIAIFGALLAAVLGGLIGAISGYFGGKLDVLLMRLVDALLAVPFLLMLVLLSRYVPWPGTPGYILLFGLVGWAGIARLVRGYMLKLRETEYSLAARAVGVSTSGIILRHLLPNALDVLIVSFTLNVAVYIVTLATLDFLDAGPSDPTWSPGTGFETILDNTWWLWAFTGGMIVLAVLSVNFIGDGLRDALDAASPSALYAEPKRSRAPQPLRWLGAAMSRGMAAATTSLGRQLFRGRVRGARLMAAVPAIPLPTERPAVHRHLPAWARIGPVPLVVFISGAAVLYGHSPLVYAPHYAVPAGYAQLYGRDEYGTVSQGRGWAWLAVSVDGHLTYQQINGKGKVTRQQVLGPGGDYTQPSVAGHGASSLGAWVSSDQTRIRAAYLGGPSSAPFWLNPPGSHVEHPDVVAVPHGFDVLFTWQRGRTADLYLAYVRNGSIHPTLRRLVHPGSYVFYPRGAVDGSGALDAMYLQKDHLGFGVWHVEFARFTVTGRPLPNPPISVPFNPSAPPHPPPKPPVHRPAPRPTGSPFQVRPPTLPVFPAVARSLGRVSYVRNTSSGFDTEALPAQWAISLNRTPDGSIWAAWEQGDICLGCPYFNSQLSVHMYAFVPGAIFEPLPHEVIPYVDISFLSLAMARQRDREILYYPQPGQSEAYLQSTAVNQDGDVVGTERVAYLGGGQADNPHAWTSAGRPVVVWQKVRADRAILMRTTWHPSQRPDLLTHLGLNIGNLWENLALLLFGSLAGGILLTAINLFLLIPLVVLWVVVSRLIPAWRWWLFLAGIAVWLAWLFAIQPASPGYVLVIPAFGFPSGWIAVAAAGFVAFWLGRYVAADTERAVRAAIMATSALFVIAALYAVIFIQGQITQI